MVALARWKYPTPKPAAVEFEDLQLPEGMNVTLCAAFFVAFKALAEKYLDSEKMYCMRFLSASLFHCPLRTPCGKIGAGLIEITVLNSMNVHPDYQRRGLGQRLMEQALKDADRDGAQTFLTASDAGKRLYVKSSFVDLETKSLDFVHLGAGGTRNTTAMMREPKSISK